jgi:antagonist of KipI
MRIDVVKPGMLSQLQDLGRHGYQHLGVPVGGAMDEWSHRMANLLAGNAEDAATLEIVMMGPSLRFQTATEIAITGADLSPTVNGAPVAMNRRLETPAGAQLDFGRRVNGMWSYLAVRGGFAATPVMGSRSAYVRGGFGGHEGRALRKDDQLETFDTAPAGRAPLLEIPSSLPPMNPGSVVSLRIVPGEQWSNFGTDAQGLLSRAIYRISLKSDRMGYRLEGPALLRTDPRELISEAVNSGTIQVPPDGQPIVLMAERQTTGGYPKVAHVIGVDLPQLAQMAPQQELRFVPVTLEEAQNLYLERELKLAALREALRSAK